MRQASIKGKHSRKIKKKANASAKGPAGAVEPALATARNCLRQGDLDGVEANCKKVLATMPEQPDAMHMLGMSAFRKKDFVLAVELLEKAIARQPASAQFHNDLGIVFKTMKHFDAAMEHYRIAIDLKPDLANPHNNLGNIFREKGQLSQAMECYQKALQLHPNFVEAYTNLGNAMTDQGSLKQAIVCYQKALAINPGNAELHCNLGNVLLTQGQLSQAMECYQKALQLSPDLVGAWNNLGTIYKQKDQLSQAMECCQKALQLLPDLVEAWNNLGLALSEQGRIEEGLANLRHALKIQPDYMLSHSNLLLVNHYQDNLETETIFAEHLGWAERFLATHPSPIKAHGNDASPGRRLRIGYVSADFRLHSVAYFVEPVLAAHDHERFEVFCYSDVQSPDSVTQHLQGLVDQWRVIFKKSDEEAEALIRDDQIDILIDLSGHTGDNRMPLFSRKPAPVQVTWIGYPNTTGLPAMDYRLTDLWADPPGLTERWHTEQLVRLPYGFLCYGPAQNTPAIADPPCAKSGYITFGSFNNRPKITPDVVALWAKIMQKLPESRLLLKAKALKDEKTRCDLEELFAQNGIPSARLDLSEATLSPLEHLRLYGRVDVALDTFPYNGTTTTCEALWMGVPVIVLTGDRHVSRVGVSLLSNLGLTELIAESAEEYLDKAVQLARDPQYLTYLRHNLRTIMRDSILTRAPLFTRSLETAYRSMWQQWCREKTERAAET